MALKSQQFDDWVNSKLEVVKTISTCRTIYIIMINIEINLPKLAYMLGYKLATTGNKLIEI